MKKAIIAIVATLLIMAVGFVALVSMQPDETRIQRSITVDAQPGDVYPLLDDYTVFVTWSPWSGLDPNQETAFSDPPSGEGAWYTWDGNDDVGSGKMTTMKVVPDQRLEQKLEFFRPFEALATTYYEISAEGDATTVVWGYHTQNNFMAKVGTLFIDMDAMLGADFEKGLAALEPLAEQAARERLEAEAEARLAAEVEAEAEELTEEEVDEPAN